MKIVSTNVGDKKIYAKLREETDER